MFNVLACLLILTSVVQFWSSVGAAVLNVNNCDSSIVMSDSCITDILKSPPVMM